jgi:hypothetical protein
MPVPRLRPSRLARLTRRMRLLAVAAAPLALAGMTVAPTTSHARIAASQLDAARTTAVTAGTAGRAPQPLSLPGLHARTATVTLITGDQVRLTEVTPGRYDASGVPDSGPASAINFEGKSGPGGLTSLQALPDEADVLTASGQVNPGLFDILWLASHGDTGSSARIPLTIQYTGPSQASALAHKAAGLPGATVTGTSAARRQVTIQVAADHAAAFWAALTLNSKASPPSLAGAAIAVWLTGHDTPATNPAPQQAGQPDYPVTVTFTRTVTGSLVPDECGDGTSTLSPDGGALLCVRDAALLGIAGGGQDNTYSSIGPVCVKGEVTKPVPVCTAWQDTFTVPAGVYEEHDIGVFITTADADGTEEKAEAELDVPQFTVTGPTAITVNANNMVPITVTSPQPARPYGPDSMGSFRYTADGTGFISVLETLNTQGAGNWWALPTPASQRATIGSYTFFPVLTMGAPLVTAEIIAPQHLRLHPLYYCDSAVNPLCFASTGPQGMVRFSGSHSLQVVNAGEGTPSDFAKIDARGKLVLIYPCETGVSCLNLWPGYQCDPNTPCDGQLAAAETAGAAGVLFTGGYEGTGTGCGPYADCWPGPLPVYADPRLSPTDPRLPYAEIDRPEADALAALTAKGPVTVTVTDHGTSPYAYQVAFYQEGGIAASQHYVLTSSKLAEVTDAYHIADNPSTSDDQPWATPLAVDQFFAVGSGWDLPGPASVRTYYGPLSPSLTWWQQSYIPQGGTSPLVFEVFGIPGHANEGWNTPPDAPGAAMPDPAVFQANPGQYTVACAFCRQGDTFYPWFFPASGANPAGEDSFTTLAPSAVQLYDQAGQEIPPGTLNGGAIFTLPAQQQRYKLEASYQQTQYGTTATTDTTWDFTSGEPSSGDYAPDGYSCAGTLDNGSTDPCNVPPLVFLRYNANTSLDNTLTAPGQHLLQVTGYHQDLNAPPVTSLKLWLSTDGGTTWQQAHVTGGRDGTWTVPYTLPQLPQTNGYLSIKVTAADAGGNDVSQTILDAVKLAGGTAGAASAGSRGK